MDGSFRQNEKKIEIEKKHGILHPIIQAKIDPKKCHTYFRQLCNELLVNYWNHQIQINIRKNITKNYN